MQPASSQARLVGVIVFARAAASGFAVSQAETLAADQTAGLEEGGVAGDDRGFGRGHRLVARRGVGGEEGGPLLREVGVALLLLVAQRQEEFGDLDLADRAEEEVLEAAGVDDVGAPAAGAVDGDGEGAVEVAMRPGEGEGPALDGEGLLPGIGIEAENLEQGGAEVGVGGAAVGRVGVARLHDVGFAGAAVAGEPNGLLGVADPDEVVGGDDLRGGGDAARRGEGGVRGGGHGVVEGAAGLERRDGADGWEGGGAPDVAGGDFDARGAVDAAGAVVPGGFEREGCELGRSGAVRSGAVDIHA